MPKASRSRVPFPQKGSQTQSFCLGSFPKNIEPNRMELLLDHRIPPCIPVALLQHNLLSVARYLLSSPRRCNKHIQLMEPCDVVSENSYSAATAQGSKTLTHAAACAGSSSHGLPRVSFRTSFGAWSRHFFQLCPPNVIADPTCNCLLQLHLFLIQCQLVGTDMWSCSTGHADVTFVPWPRRH